MLLIAPAPCHGNVNIQLRTAQAPMVMFAQIGWIVPNQEKKPTH
jgi:hypothetical protein